jgi:zinc protease
MNHPRFVLPEIGEPVPVAFPAIGRETLANGLSVWSIAHTSVPVASAYLVIRHGAAADPPGRPGLMGVTADLLDEAAGPYDAIQLADAFARLGSQLSIEVGSDVSVLGFTTLARFLTPALTLLADVVGRPRLAGADLTRVRELRMNRLRQLSSVASAAADRVFHSAIFGAHPYGHGVLGTTRALTEITLDEVRDCCARLIRPNHSTLIVSGDVEHGPVVNAARGALSEWMPINGAEAQGTIPGPPTFVEDQPTLLVHRPRAPQAELRIGHRGPPRRVEAYHQLVTINAALGGQFTSRLNATLREKKGLTYGVHSAFDFRRLAGSFACETSVEAVGVAEALSDVLREFEAVRGKAALADDELARAKAALTRGYVRHFETAEHLVRAAVQLVTYGLDDQTFDRFVPEVERVSVNDALAAARTFIHPDQATVAVVGDADECRGPIEALGRRVSVITPEF